MTLRIRRVVTGHDAAGKAVVTIDEISQNLRNDRPGCEAAVIWSTARMPADNMEPGDPALRVSSTSLEKGTVFRIIDYAPGVAPRNHRTLSIDYAVVLSGEIHMRLDSAEVHLHAGDVVVQRGTIHNWENRGKEICRIAFILIGADPVTIDGKTLPQIG